RRGANKVPSLPEHRSNSGHLEHQPLHDVVARAGLRRHELTGLLRQVEKDRAGLKERKRLPAWTVMVDYRGHPVVRADLEELGRELLALADIHRNDSVIEPGLLEKNRNLVSVRCRPIVQIDHFGSPSSTPPAGA